jgi:hypothetical protein
MSEVLLDSKPLTDTNQAENLRENLVTLVKLVRKVLYSHRTNLVSDNKYLQMRSSCENKYLKMRSSNSL